jgi:aryl-alcohol dehydrogenase-like predicted oxidoreductase
VFVDPAELVCLGPTDVKVSRFGLGGTPFGDMYQAVPDDQAVGRIPQGGDLPPTFEYSPEAVARSLAGSYDRLGLDRVDVVHVHDPDVHMDEVMGVTLPALRALQREGRIRAVSAGMNHAAPLARFVRAGLVDCVMVAGRWTLLDQSALDERPPGSCDLTPSPAPTADPHRRQGDLVCQRRQRAGDRHFESGTGPSSASATAALP